MTIFVSVDALGMMMSYEGVSATSLGKFYAYSIPEIIYRMVPVACLLSLVFTLSTLNRSNELVALFSVGMSLVRICIPILIWVLMLTGVVFFMGDQVLPNFARHKNFVFYHEIKKNPSLYSMVKTNKIWYRSKDTIFYLKTLNEKTKKAQGLTLYYFNDKWDLIQMMTAKEVDMSGANWNLKDGSVTIFTEDSSFPLTSQFKQKTIVMSEDAKDISASANTAEVLSLNDLSEFIKRNKEAGLDTVRYEVDYHSKYGYPFAALVMSLLGIPFSVSRARSGGTMMNFGICLGLVAIYWGIYNSALSLGNYGYIPPIMAAWLPNFLTAVGAYILIKRTKV